VAWQLQVLRTTSDPRREQVAIGIGARMGNGLLICLLAWLLLRGQGAGGAATLGLVALITTLYAVTFVTLTRRPDDVLIGYKG
jgi:hypothetical protein